MYGRGRGQPQQRRLHRAPDRLGAGQYNQHWDREPIAGQRALVRVDSQTLEPLCEQLPLQTAAGSRVIQWDCVWASNQQWELRGVIDP